MYRNLFLIFVLAAGLAGLLIWQPWKGEEAPPPSIYDRLPDAEIIGISDVLQLSSSLSENLFYYKIPFRDLISPDFILSQGKNYGLDVQSPVFFFMNEKENLPDDWGVMVSVRDSSKVREGIENLQKFVGISVREVDNFRVYSSSELNGSVVYGNDWMLLYQGHQLDKILQRVIHAKHNDVSPRWQKFIKENNTHNEGLIASVSSDEFDEQGIASAYITLSNDSSSLVFNTVITQNDSLSFQANPVGPSFYPQEYTKRLINLHFDVDRLRHRPNDPIYKVMKKLASKISFPLQQFLNTWEGDVAFRQGGLEVIHERYVESELDENFNVTEVEKYRKVKVSGFSLFLSTNDRLSSFLKLIEDKGILTAYESKYRLLFSPPLNLHTTDSSLVFHTSRYRPAVTPDSTNEIMWTFDYTPVQFFIDSTSVKTVYGRIRLPLKKIVSDNIAEIEE